MPEKRIDAEEAGALRVVPSNEAVEGAEDGIFLFAIDEPARRFVQAVRRAAKGFPGFAFDAPPGKPAGLLERNVLARAERAERKLAEVEGWYARCATACAVEYVADGVDSAPGPIEDVERAIREGARALGEAVELRKEIHRLHSNGDFVLASEDVAQREAVRRLEMAILPRQEMPMHSLRLRLQRLAGAVEAAEAGFRLLLPLVSNGLGAFREAQEKLGEQFGGARAAQLRITELEATLRGMVTRATEALQYTKVAPAEGQRS